MAEAEEPGELGAIEPSKGFKASKDAAVELHSILEKLKAAKTGGKDDMVATQEMQRQLLVMRRAHRAMVKMAENGRTLEAAARRAADAEYAHLETRQYESACCRAAARRCRNLPTPQLNELRPLLDGFKEDEDEENEIDADPAADGSKTRLAGQLEAEKLERSRLAEELEVQEKLRKAEMEAFREREKLGAELTVKLTAVERSMEPVIDLLQLRPQTGNDGIVTKLPAPLRLVYSKFEALAAKEGGLSISIEETSTSADAAAVPPPEKKRRLEVAEPEKLLIAVKISHGAGEVTLHFANPCQSLVTVAIAQGTDGLLDDLWPEDDGRNSAVLSLLPGAALEKGIGRPYGWAQVLAGLREEALTAAPNLHAMEGVEATQVIAKLRVKLAGNPAAQAA